MLGISAGVVFLASCSKNTTAEDTAAYKQALAAVGSDGPAMRSSRERAAVRRFTSFLKNVGQPTYVVENVAKVYAPDAYLDDTLATHRGQEEIRAYFVKLGENMKDFSLEVDDVARSGADHYVRWTMRFTQSPLGKGKPIVSVGISQVRFNAKGQVAFQQDFWDSGSYVYAQVPVIGGMIQAMQKSMN